MREQVLRPSSRRALIWRSDQPNHRLAIFVHGFGGGHLSTWDRFPTLLRDHADADAVLGEWDYLFLGYRTMGLSGIRDFRTIAALVQTQIEDAMAGRLEGPASQPYNEFALLAHSLGTLGVRNLVASPAACPYPGFGHISKIGLIGTPLDGSVLALLGQWIAPIGASLRPRSPELVALKSLVRNAWRTRPWPNARIRLGAHDLVVGAHFIHWEGDEAPPSVVASDHSSICKPRDMGDDPMGFLRSTLA